MKKTNLSASGYLAPECKTLELKSLQVLCESIFDTATIGDAPEEDYGVF